MSLLGCASGPTGFSGVAERKAGKALPWTREPPTSSPPPQADFMGSRLRRPPSKSHDDFLLARHCRKAQPLIL